MSFIRRLGDPVLKRAPRPVDRFDDSLRAQVERMAGIMRDAFGMGLAAPQLGHLAAAARLHGRAGRPGDRRSPTRRSSGRARSSEVLRRGLPVDPRHHRRRGPRRCYVRVRARDEEGEERLVEASGLEARVIQHEIDHLDGVLILDRTTRDEPQGRAAGAPRGGAQRRSGLSQAIGCAVGRPVSALRRLGRARGAADASTGRWRVAYRERLVAADARGRVLRGRCAVRDPCVVRLSSRAFIALGLYPRSTAATRPGRTIFGSVALGGA